MDKLPIITLSIHEIDTSLQCTFMLNFLLNCKPIGCNQNLSQADSYVMRAFSFKQLYRQTHITSDNFKKPSCDLFNIRPEQSTQQQDEEQQDECHFH